MARPTVGENVQLHRNGYDHSIIYDIVDEEPCAATITRVWSAGLVNVLAIDRKGSTLQLDSIPFVPDGGETPEAGQWYVAPIPA